MFSALPENISTYGSDIDGILHLIYVIVGFFFIAIEGYIIYALIRYRRKDGVKAEYETGESWREMRWIAGIVILVVILDFAIDHRGGDVWAKVKVDMPAGDVRVRVVAQQFSWSFVYPGADGQFDTADDLTVARVLHVPVNRKIRLTLTSKDVIHSFFLPEVRLKQDIMPGRQIEAWFEATKVGKSSLVCAELCGLGHTRMMGELAVHDQADYDQWLADMTREMLQ